MKLRRDLAAVLPRLCEQDLYKFCAFYERYAPYLPAIASSLYDRLGASDQARFVVWFLKRWAKIDLVNPVERGLYETTIEQVKHEERAQVLLHGRPYRLRDFKSQGHDFQLLGYDWVLGVHDMLYNQYECDKVRLAPDDVIIDAGAFIGDTAVYFHHKLGGRCQIHSFELLDENLALMLHNLERNSVSDDQVVINKLALADRSGDEIVVAGGSSQGATSMFGRTGQGDRVQTVTLDEYVVRMHVPRVDFIKMDIEGAEVQALKGAQQSIAHFRPRLAICLYHKWDDAFTVPQAILASGVDYDFSFKWVQLKDGWEAVLLATPSAKDETRSTAAPPPDRTEGSDALAAVLSILTSAYARKWAQADAMWREKQRTQAVSRGVESAVAVAV